MEEPAGQRNRSASCEAACAVWDSAAGCTSDGRDDCEAAGVEAFATSAVTGTGVGTTVAAGAVLEAMATAATAVGDDVATATCRCPGATRLAMLALLAALVALAIAGVAGVPATERLGFGASLEMGVIPPSVSTTSRGDSATSLPAPLKLRRMG